MTEQELIGLSRMAWVTEDSRHIPIPVHSTDGTHLLDIAFYKEGHCWVGRIHHDEMVTLVKEANALRKEVKDE